LIIATSIHDSLKILITGGAGFIGKYLVEYFAKTHTVLVYDDLSNSTKKDSDHIVTKGAMFCKGDILNFEKLLEFSKDVDVIIHLAAKSDVSESVIHPEITNKVNVAGTQNVLQCCVQNKIKKIIFASSAAVYGDCKDNPINEKSDVHPLSPYGQSKLDAEKIIQNTCEQNNINYVILRMFNVYGRGQNDQYAGVITKFLQNILQKKPIVIYGDGKQTRDFVSVYDVVEAFECALNSNKNGTYNIANGRSLSIDELAKIICEKFGEQEIVYTQKKHGDIRNSIADVSLAKNELGFFAKRKLEDEISNIYP